MKLFAINGSPRKDGNTATLLNHGIKGAASQGAEVELINLYDLDFKGCISCFACKKTLPDHGTCVMQDDLTPVLERLKSADGILFGSPLYFLNISSGMSAFLERFLFPYSVYDKELQTLFPKKIPTGFIYTMNSTEAQFEQSGVRDTLMPYQKYIEILLGYHPHLLYSCDTYQFTNYSDYVTTIFSEPKKALQKAEQFPIDCKKAFDIGVHLLG